MAAPRFFCDSISQSDTAVISDIQFKHLARVLRLKEADTVELFDGKGTVAQAVIEKIEKNQVRLKVLDKKTFDPAGRQKIVIASSVAKGQRFELNVAKCTELGIDRIVPVIFERTVKQQLQAKRLESIAVESAKQCGRIFLPVIDKPLILEDCLKDLQRQYPKSKIIFGSLSENIPSVMNFDSGSDDCIAFVGPEGGLTQQEEDLLKRIGAFPVRLNSSVLRIETAAIAFAAILAAKRP